MNITEFMSFDLAWFTTLPGVLITGGVVVLLIALILFIASNKKDKNKETVPVENNINSDVPQVMDNNFAAGATMGMMDSPVMTNNNIMMNNDVNGMGMGVNAIPSESAQIAVPEVEPVVPVAPIDEMPVVSTYSATPSVTNAVDFSTPAVDVQTLPNVELVSSTVSFPSSVPKAAPVTPTENVVDVMPVVQDMVPTVQIQPEAVEVAPVAPSVPVETQLPVQEQPVIYGGANPANVVATPVQEQPVIYGGANPLENTTTLPMMSNHEAYSGSSIVSTVEPAKEEISSTPVPEVEPVAPIQPMVEEATPIETSVPVTPEVSSIPAMPMTGADMFATSDAPVASDEIETLDF